MWLQATRKVTDEQRYLTPSDISSDLYEIPISPSKAVKAASARSKDASAFSRKLNFQKAQTRSKTWVPTDDEGDIYAVPATPSKTHESSISTAPSKAIKADAKKIGPKFEPEVSQVGKVAKKVVQQKNPAPILPPDAGKNF